MFTRVARIAGWTVVLVALLALTGQAMSPPWSLTPYTDHVSVASPSTAIRARGVSTTPEGTYRVRESHMTVTLGNAERINAIVREPIGAPPGHPACLFIHGAGTGKASEAYGDIASAMASAGITTLVPDKRLSNYSDLHRDYQSSADDYARSFEQLKARNGVDPGSVGVYAESEGTWIASIIVARRTDVAFAILTSPPVYSGRQQVAMAIASYADTVGMPRQFKGIIPKVTGMSFWPFGLEYASFDASRNLRHLTMPVLVNYGTLDPSMPTEQGAKALLRATHDAGNRNATVRYYPANHQMRQGAQISKPGLPLAGGYTKDLEQWVNAVAAGTQADDWTTPQIAGDQPRQPYAVPERVTHGPIASLGLMLILIAAGLGACALAAVIGIGFAVHAAIIRRRLKPVGGRFDPGMRAPLWTAGALAVVTMLGLLAYLSAAVPRILRLESAPLLYQGGWWALRLGALAAAATFTWLVTTMISCRHHIAIGASHSLVIVLVLFGSLTLMIMLAFWNLYLP